MSFGHAPMHPLRSEVSSFTNRHTRRKAGSQSYGALWVSRVTDKNGRSHDGHGDSGDDGFDEPVPTRRAARLVEGLRPVPAMA